MAYRPSKSAGTQFVPIRRRLLVANLLVFAGVLAGFAIAVRTVFVYNLRQQQVKQITVLAQAAVALVELEEGNEASGKLDIETEDLPAADLIAQQRGLQWFDLQEALVKQVGQPTPQTRLNPDSLDILETTPVRLQAVTLPVIIDGEIRGYVRASQTLVELDAIIAQLDLGLGVGVAVALVLSGTGALWLNRQAMAPIEVSFGRLQRFTADASHELRSPLMAISSNAEVALKYPDGMRAGDRDTFDVILSAAEQMEQLTTDLLMLARTDQPAALETTPVDISDLLKTLRQLYQPQAQQQKLALTAHILPGLCCQGNLALLQRAFTNLIQNAIRYTPAAGAIAIETQQHAKHLQITVSDTGIGIAPEHLEVIFERFWRADQARHHADGGSGLGLAITQAIIHRHGGTIVVNSQVNQGSQFTVTLPSS